MANEIENNDDDDKQQNEQQQDTEHASTGSEQWDKLIDGVAGTGKVPTVEAEQNDKRGKAAGDTEQSDKDKQLADKDKQPDQNRQQRGQGDDQDQTPQPPRAPPRKFGNLFQADQKGDIYDSNGALVARQGAQRMIFHRLYPVIEAKERELNGLRSTVESYQEANALAKKEGLSLDEHGAALQMFVSYKKDPVKTLNTLLTLAADAGRDVSSIRQPSGPGVADIRSAVQEIVQEAIKPFSFLTEQQREMQEQNALQDEVVTAYTAFIEEFPDAKIHEGALASVMRDRGVSNREAYYMVRTFAAERGLDWNKPLAEQLVAGDKQQNNGRNPSGGGNNRRQLPALNGRSRSEAAHVKEGALDQANASDSWDIIARRAMAKAGISV